MDKIDINTENICYNQASFDKYNVSSKIINEIKAEIQKEKANGNNDFSVAIFAPSKINTSSLQTANKNNQNTVNEDGPTTTSTSYYQYVENNISYSMQDYDTKYWNCITKMLENKGSNAMNVASSFYNLILSAVGTISQTVSIFGVGTSALAFYQSLYGPVAYGQQGDYCSTNTVCGKIWN